MFTGVFAVAPFHFNSTIATSKDISLRGTQSRVRNIACLRRNMQQQGRRLSQNEVLVAKGPEKPTGYLIRGLGRGGGKVCDLWCDVTPGYPHDTKL